MLDDPVTRFWALFIDSELAVCDGDMQRATQRTNESRALADELGQPTLLWSAALHEASLLHFADPDEADPRASAALEFGQESGEADAIMMFGAQQAQLWLLHGEWDLLLSTLEDSAAAFPALPAFNAGLAVNRARLGEIELAAGQLAAAKDRDYDSAYVDNAMSTALRLWAEVAIRVVNRDAVIRLEELLAQITDRVIYSGALCFGAIDAFRAVLAWELGRDEEAEALWQAGMAQRTDGTSTRRP